MSDESLSPDHELASAYVDGQASAPERAQVEASPELMALVRSFREQRASLAAVAPVADAVRDTAVMAALAEFDTLVAAPPAAPPTNVVSLERHRRWNRVLGAAAAVAAVGVLGVAVASIGGSSDDRTSTGGAAPGQAETLQGDDSKVGIAGTASDPSNLAPTVSGDPSPVQDTASGGGVDTTAGGTATIGTIGSIDGAGSTAPAMSDPAALRALPEPKTAVSPSFVLDCSLTTDQEILLEITWRGTPAVVVRDTVSGVITVLDAQCNTLVTVPN